MSEPRLKREEKIPMAAYQILTDRSGSAPANIFPSYHVLKEDAWSRKKNRDIPTDEACIN